MLRPAAHLLGRADVSPRPAWSFQAGADTGAGSAASMMSADAGALPFAGPRNCSGAFGATTPRRGAVLSGAATPSTPGSGADAGVGMSFAQVSSPRSSTPRSQRTPCSQRSRSASVPRTRVQKALVRVGLKLHHRVSGLCALADKLEEAGFLSQVAIAEMNMLQAEEFGMSTDLLKELRTDLSGPPSYTKSGALAPPKQFDAPQEEPQNLRDAHRKDHLTIYPSYEVHAPQSYGHRIGELHPLGGFPEPLRSYAPPASPSRSGKCPLSPTSPSEERALMKHLLRQRGGREHRQSEEELRISSARRESTPDAWRSSSAHRRISGATFGTSSCTRGMEGTHVPQFAKELTSDLSPTFIASSAAAPELSSRDHGWGNRTLNQSFAREKRSLLEVQGQEKLQGVCLPVRPVVAKSVVKAQCGGSRAPKDDSTRASSECGSASPLIGQSRFSTPGSPEPCRLLGNMAASPSSPVSVHSRNLPGASGSIRARPAVPESPTAELRKSLESYHSSKLLLIQGSQGSTASHQSHQTHASSARGHGMSGRHPVRSSATPRGSARAPLGSPLEQAPHSKVQPGARHSTPQFTSSGGGARTPQSPMTPSPQPSLQPSPQPSPQLSQQVRAEAGQVSFPRERFSKRASQESSSGTGNYPTSPFQPTPRGAGDGAAAAAAISSAVRSSHSGQQPVTQGVDGPGLSLMNLAPPSPEPGPRGESAAAPQGLPSANAPRGMAAASLRAPVSACSAQALPQPGIQVQSAIGAPQEERPPSPWRTGSLRGSEFGPQRSSPGHDFTIGDRVRAPDGRLGTVRFGFSPIEWGVKLDGDVGVYHFTTKELQPVKG